MKKSKRKPHIRLKAVVILIIVVVVAGFVYLQFGKPSVTGIRPKHCDEKGCIPEGVFAKLPSYPEDLPIVYQLVYFQRIKVLENFSESVPDENYYKQPEFYPTWESTGIGFYSLLREDELVQVSYPPSIGFGAYPGDQFFSIQKGGGRIDVISFWHSAWGVINWQGMELQTVYPTSGSLFGFDIEQDPEEVEKYITVELIPNILLLEPSFPSFEPNWAQRVNMIIRVNETTPSGKYLVGVIAVDPPSFLADQWTRKYKLGYASVGSAPVGIGRSTLQILIEIV